jgi:hypothetical protein
MKVRVRGAASHVVAPGLGIVETNTWFEVTDEQAATFLRESGGTLEEAASVLGSLYEVKKQKSNSEEAE